METDPNGNGGWIDLCEDITKHITISNGGKPLNGNRNTGKYNFKVVSSNTKIDKLKYNNSNREVWILVHGWKNNPNNWACKDNQDDNDFAKTILSQKQDAIILCLDWSDISASDTGNTNLEPDVEASWIDVTASSVVEKLKAWGLDENTAHSKLNLIGHSLGTIMSGTISQKYNKANYLLAMDPPGRQPAAINWGSDGDGFYPINKKQDNIFSTFQDKANFTRAFVSAGTPSDNPKLAETADESILVYNKSSTCNYLKKNNNASLFNPNTWFEFNSCVSTNHFVVQDHVKTWLKNNNNFCNTTRPNPQCSYFNLNDNKNTNNFRKDKQTTNSLLQYNFNGFIKLTDENQRQFLSTRETSGDYTQLGTNEDNLLDPNTDQNDNNVNMYGAGGGDIFYNHNSFIGFNINLNDFNDTEILEFPFNKSFNINLNDFNGTEILEFPFNKSFSINIKDFNDTGDRISLKRIDPDININYTYAINSNTITKNTVPDVVVEGSRVGEVSQANLDDVFLSTTKTSNGVFIKR